MGRSLVLQLNTELAGVFITSDRLGNYFLDAGAPFLAPTITGQRYILVIRHDWLLPVLGNPYHGGLLVLAELGGVGLVGVDLSLLLLHLLVNNHLGSGPGSLELDSKAFVELVLPLCVCLILQSMVMAGLLMVVAGIGFGNFLLIGAPFLAPCITTKPWLVVLFHLPMNHLLVMKPHNGGCVLLYMDLAGPLVVEIRLENFLGAGTPFLAPLITTELLLVVLLLLLVNHLLVDEPYSGRLVLLYIGLTGLLAVDIRLGNFVNAGAPSLASLWM